MTASVVLHAQATTAAQLRPVLYFRCRCGLPFRNIPDLLQHWRESHEVPVPTRQGAKHDHLR